MHDDTVTRPQHASSSVIVLTKSACSRVSDLLADTARDVDRRLATIYGRKRRGRSGDPLDGLIRTILSQNTSDVNSHRAFTTLREAFPTWQDVCMASESEISAAIGRGGLANVKAARIKAILEQIYAARGELSLEFLKDWGTQEALQYLLNFKGVGAKTAACVLTFYCGRDVFPVDTHVFRVARRLGWLEPGTTPERAHKVLQERIPSEVVYQLHLNMVQHGRKICRPQRPACGECPLGDICAYPEQNNGSRKSNAGF